VGQDGTAVTASPAMIEMAKAILAAAGPVAQTLRKVQEAADLIGVHQSTVYRHIAAGRLEAVRAGRSIRIPDSSLLAYLRPVIAQTPSPVSTHALDGAGTRAGLGPIANGVRTAGPDGSKVTPESPSGPAAGGTS